MTLIVTCARPLIGNMIHFYKGCSLQERGGCSSGVAFRLISWCCYNVGQCEKLLLRLGLVAFQERQRVQADLHSPSGDAQIRRLGSSTLSNGYDSANEINE